MNHIDLSIIIVDYNAKDFLKACLESIQNSKIKASYEVIVVDNASPSSAEEMIKKEFAGVAFIKSEKNLGFGKGNNLGIQKAKGKFILFLNPDTVVSSGVIDGMLQFMEDNSKAGAATCRLEQPDGNIDYASHRGFPTPWNSFTYFSGLAKVFPHSKLFSGYTLGYQDLHKTHEIDALAGAFMLVNREAGEEVGWWDEDYFFNGEDIDFCYRLKQKGWEIYYVPEFKILHYNGVSGGTKKHSQQITTASRETKRFITKHRYDAMKIFYKKHYAKKYPKIVTWGVMQGISLKEWITMRKI